MKVFITVDTEIWPDQPRVLGAGLAEGFNRDICGCTSCGDFGIPYQIQVLNAHGLKAVFFVEALFACAVGLDPLRKIVNMIQDNGHEVQLHIHTEWLTRMPAPILPDKTGKNMKDFTLAEQILLIAHGLKNLHACGARNVCAFRAGNYGANFDTLRALAKCELAFDASYNAGYLDSDCGLRTSELLLKPCVLEGVHEFPISVFQDFPGHYRHAQLTACSSSEMECSMIKAWQRGWHSFVLVSHSFELITGRKRPPHPVRPDSTVIKRFERLCRFLANNADRFQTATFAEIAPDTMPLACSGEPVVTGIHRTFGRVVQQLGHR